ncbi:F-box protein skip19, partial [Thalictrum thalictroides]
MESHSSNSKRVRKITKRKGSKEVRNWLDLPHDVIIQIFLKLGVVEILYNVQRVCSLWRKLAKEPQLFRCIDMRNPWKYFDPCNFDPFRRMARKAMIQSRGQIEEISMEYFGTDEHIYRAIGKSKARSLRAIRLVSCYQVSDDALIDIAKENPLLEELELIFCSFMTETIATV